MAAAHPQLDRMQQRQFARFERMGLSARPMPDGRSLLVALPLSDAPVDTVAATLRPKRILFSTLGPHLIKCLRPRAFFGLPPIDIRRCADAASIESTIRQAWRVRTRELRETSARLRELGIEFEPTAENSALAFPLPGEPSAARVMMHRIGEAILPSAGPLSDMPLESPADRVLEVSDRLLSAADLEGRIGQRIDELAASRREALERDRIRSRFGTPEELEGPPKQRHPVPGRRPKILIVGPGLVSDEALRAELERQGFRTVTSLSETEALRKLASMSPDLVISQYGLGRSDGASLVQAMRELPGIERIPVVLFDDVRNEGRREIARAVGAVGYLSEPIQNQRFVRRLGFLAQEPGNRRFTRYPLRLSARLEGASQTCLITEVGRGGVFIATPQVLEMQTAMRGKMALPELGKALLFEGEVRYCAEPQGATRQGIGLRFFDMSEEDEATLIEYLARLESRD